MHPGFPEAPPSPPSPPNPPSPPLPPLQLSGGEPASHFDRVYEFVTPAGMPFEEAFTVTPSSVAMPDEPQGEGIDYFPDGRGFVTSGEGSRAPIVQTSCPGVD